MYLEKIKNPSEIQKLRPEELKHLATEVRQRIVEVISRTGGHLAPSLGAVDFTVALLKIFNPPQDSIIWDVGHQSYAWKILTGRNARFDTIRQKDGLSGFPKREESPCDAFGTGHSSTSVSAALGIACAREDKCEDYCIAVIGDGALTGGMSFEALNHAGHLQPDKFIVILNDNEMSISKNVGGLQKYMARMLVSKSYNILKKQIWDWSSNLPERYRKKFIHGAQKLEESLINILVPHILFEDLGFKYVGPMDGHDIESLIDLFHRVKHNMVGPVFIHLVTRKGKGYEPAEKDSSLYHGIGPFDQTTGKPSGNSVQTWSEVMGNTLVKIAGIKPSTIAITAAMSSGTGLMPFEEKYPERFYDVGIAEQHAVTFAAGLAANGMKPFFAVYSTFLQRSLDQIIHDVALQKLPVVFCIDRAGFVGEDGPTHHGAFDISYLSFIPNLVILVPSSAEEFIAMLHWAAGYQDGPVAIRYPRGTAYYSGKDKIVYEPAKAEIIRIGKDLALLSCGHLLPLAAEICDNLTAAGHNPWLVDARSLKPLDIDTCFLLAKSCRHIFTLEANALTGGFGSAVRDLLCNTPAKVISFGYPDKFMPHGSIAELDELVGLTADELTRRICDLI